MNRRKILAFLSLTGAGAAGAVSAHPEQHALEDTGARTLIKAGDMVVVSTDVCLTKDQCESLRDHTKEIFRSQMGIDVSVMVVSAGIKLSVISKDVG